MTTGRVISALLVPTLLVLCGGLGSPARAEDRARPPRSAAEERARRESSVTELAPAPAPRAADPLIVTTEASLPLLGADGQDEYGYPTRTVDRAALRGLLLRRGFAQLTEIVERLQAEFEADPRKEYWVSDAAEALGTGEKELEPVLDAWATASPRSFAPFLARAHHWNERAFERRGGKWAHETPPEDLDAMERALARARPDLKRALELRPGLVAAMDALLTNLLPFAGSRPEEEAVVDAALRVCPSCVRIRATYLHSLTPRWGGSYAAMQDFVERRCGADGHLRLLAGYADLDRAKLLVRDDRYDEALEAVERACALGDHWAFLRERAEVNARLGRAAAALRDANRALVLRPGHPELLVERAYVHGKAERWEAAGEDLRAALRVDPASGRARAIHRWIVKGLVRAGWQRHVAGDREGALRRLDLAAELAPTDADVQSWRASVVRHGGAGDLDAERAPDDFRAVQRLDYALARQGRFERVVALWDDFLARHPDHGRAHLERGGALFHLNRRDEARDEAQAACELGVSEGCVRARQLGAARARER